MRGTKGKESKGLGRTERVREGRANYFDFVSGDCGCDCRRHCVCSFAAVGPSASSINGFFFSFFVIISFANWSVVGCFDLR